MADDSTYRVSWSASAVIAMRQAARSRRGRAALRLVRTIHMRLTADPTGFGEIYRSRGAIEEYTGALDFASIDFAVDTKRKLVLVRHFQLMS